MQRIFLTGLPGSGKSTVGQQVARLLEWRFADTDDLISKHMKFPVGQVLVQYGEQRFREIESEALVSAAMQEHTIIATGGGIVIAESNRTFMHTYGLTVYLEVSVDAAWRRIQEHMKQSGITVVRPLIGGEDGLQRLQNLYTARRQWYEQAILHLNTDVLSPDSIAHQIVDIVLTQGG